eukprot:749342-Hanusia_phi.AAC.2
MTWTDYGDLSSVLGGVLWSRDISKTYESHGKPGRCEGPETLWKSTLTCSSSLAPDLLAAGNRCFQRRALGGGSESFLGDVQAFQLLQGICSVQHGVAQRRRGSTIRTLPGDEGTARSFLLEAIQAGGMGGGLGVKLEVFPMAAACHTRLGLIYVRPEPGGSSGGTVKPDCRLGRKNTRMHWRCFKKLTRSSMLKTASPAESLIA